MRTTIAARSLFLSLVLSLAVAAWASPAGASNAILVHPSEGAATCTQIFPSTVQTVSVPVALNGTYGPTAQRIVVQFNADKSAIQSWQVAGTAQPVNAVIIKRGTAGLVYHFGPVGTRQDTDLAAPAGTGSIQSIRFCYGLGGATPSTPVRACTLATDEVTCTPSTQPFINYKVVLGAPGERVGYELCQCNVASLSECDPNGEPGVAGSCIEDDQLFELPSHTEFGNTGTYFCTTVSGRRLCYSRKSP